MKYPVALFIGRFQPFHNGHAWEVEEALKKAEKVIIGIGSSNVNDENNPYDVVLRDRMIHKVIDEYGWKERVVGVIPIPDTTDPQWVRNVVRGVEGLGYRKGETLVLGNNDWVNDLLAAELFPVHETGLYNRQELEGVKIRRMIRVGDSAWQERVPKGVAEILIGV
ncbi:MAG: adenylyltransferase/cytidyltransferase family protein [bacterium]